MLTLFLMANFVRFMAAMRISPRQLIWISVIILGFVAASAWTQNGGFLLYGEADWFLIDHNTDQRSYLSKVICPHLEDAQHYCAREIAFVVENFDAKFIHLCVMAGHPHFLAVSNYVFLGGILGMMWLVAVRHGVNPTTACLVALLLATSPPIFMSGSYVRSGHAMAAFLMTALALFIFHQSQSNAEAPVKRRAWAVTFSVALPLVWCDRQGLVAACGIGLIVLIANPSNLRWVYVSAIASAISIHTFHFLVTGPYLVAHFTPFSDVTISHNMLAVAGADKKPITDNIAGGLTIALSNLRYLCGGIPYPMAAGLVLAGGWLLKRRWWLPVIVVSVIAGMNCVMLAASDVLLWPDCLPSIYYNIISTVALGLVIAYVAFRLRGHRFELGFCCVLGVLVVCNVCALPGHVETFKRGHLTGFIAGAPYVREALKAAATSNEPGSLHQPKYDALESCRFVEWKWVMKNPLEYGGKLSAQEFVESSQYLQFVRSERRLPYGRGGR